MITKKKLGNGLSLILDKRATDSVVVQILVKTGSNNETPLEAGLSHFLEHMVFEGSEKYNTSKKLSSEIEKLGGELNAATSNTKTYFYAKVPKKHLAKALEVISQIVFYPLFRQKDFEKERKIILDEINMIKDQPLRYQWDLFTETLFIKHPTKKSIAGTHKSIKEMTLERLKNYYKKHYKTNNMTLVISGNFTNSIKKIEKYFNKKIIGNVPKQKKVIEPKQKRKIATEKRKIGQSYYVLGYKTVPQKNKDSYVLELIRAILARGQSGRLFEEIRGKRGLAYVVGAHHEAETDFGYFAIFCGTDKKNKNKIIKIVLDEFNKLQQITKNDLQEAKTFIEGEFLLDNEENERRSITIADWEHATDLNAFNNYLKEIKKITLADFKRVAKKYLTKEYILTGIEQK